MTSEKANSVKLTFGKNNLAITANSPEVGEARETMAINYKGKELAIAFNPRDTSATCCSRGIDGSLGLINWR